MSKKIDQFLVIFICAIISVLPTSTAFAATDTVSLKEEIIYANLDGTGAQTGTYVVNILNSENGRVLDYGDYNSIRNMTTSDVLDLSDGKITGIASNDRIYYEGVIEDAQLPWTINIKYYLDGKEMNAADIAGGSGALKITVSISKNEKADPAFFDNYTLQTIIRLDTDQCKNIVSDGATQANVGKVKQLTYTVMAGQEKEIELIADVTDFEMVAMSFNGIRSSIDINANQIDTTELGSGVDELHEATSNINEGAGQINDGTKELEDGAKTLLSGAETMQEALDTLNDSSSTLVDGSADIQKALLQIQTSLNAVTTSFENAQKLSTASVDIKKGIDSLVGGLMALDGNIDTYNQSLSANKVDIDTVISQSEDMISSLNSSLLSMKSNYQVMINNGPGETEQAKTLYNQIQSYTGIITLLTANEQIISGSNQVILAFDSALDPDKGQLMIGADSLQNNYAALDSSIQQLVLSLDTLNANMTALKSGIDTLVTKYGGMNLGIIEYTDAVKEITDGFDNIYDGVKSMAEGASSLYDATQELSAGTLTFADETANLNTDIQDKIDGMLDDISGSDYQVKSFVSDKNTKIEAVQFVIQTTAIEKASVDTIYEDNIEHLTFWQKLLRLFGLY